MRAPDGRSIFAALSLSLCLGSGCSSSSSSNKGGPADAGSAGTDTAATGGGKSGSTNAGSSGRAGATGGNGTAATGGKATGGTGGAGSGGKSAAPTPDTGASVLERNKHASRDGHFIQPTLSKQNAAKMAKDASFAATFVGNMWASPLYLENGPNGKGVFFAVTTGNDVVALDETNGGTLWKHNIGDSPTVNGVPCGNIHPLGILSTPVIDAETRTIFVAGAIGTNAIARHELHALSVDTGEEQANWPVDVSKLASDQLKFNAPAQNQRSALSIVNGVVYVAYGGHVGDCGDYHGWVMAVDGKDPSKHGAWATLGRGEAIWAAGGMASDGSSVFAVTGNSTSSASSRTASDSEQVVKLTGMASFDRMDKNLYFPASWRSMDGADADFGASSPLYLEVPGATPQNYVLAIAKDGHFYLLDASNLGGMAGHVADFTVSSGSMSIRTVPAAYTTSQGVHVVFSTVNGASKCPQGGPSGTVIMSVRIPPGSPPKPEVAWCASLGGGETAPIATTTDGTNEAIVWYMNGGKLTAVDGDTGKAIWNSGSDTCSGVRKWTSPIAVKGRIVVGGDDHLCAWAVK